MKFTVTFQVGPFSSLKPWEGEAQSSKTAVMKALIWATETSALGINIGAPTQALASWEEEGQLHYQVFDLKGGSPKEISGPAAPVSAPKKAEAAPASKGEPKGWPFKHLSAHSQWPMQGLVVRFAAAVLHAPKPARKEAALKFVERCFRMGARLAREFDLDPVEVLKVARLQIQREVPGAKEAIGEAKALEHAEADKLAQDIVSAELSKLFTSPPDEGAPS